MKILFLGPYRHADLDGLLSYNIIRNIATKHNIVTRPIYYHNNTVNIPEDILELENKNIYDYDILVQHVRPKDCLLTSQFKKNILIPIIKSNDIENDIFIDNTIDSILTDDDYDIDFVRNNSSKIENFDFSLMIKIDSGHVFDLGIWNKYKKLYTITNNLEDKDIVYSLIRSFIHLRNIVPQEFCLSIYISNIEKNELSLIEEYIKQNYAAVKASHTINKIVLVPIEINETTIVAAHNSGDIFLDVSNSTKNKINKKLAIEKKKTILKIEEVSSGLEFMKKPISKFLNQNNDISICNAINNHFANDEKKKKQKENKTNIKNILDLI